MPKHLKLNDTDYWVYNDKPKLTTIVMIHGLRGTHHGLELIAKNLDGYRVIVPDLPGFGESKPLENSHSILNYVKWLNKFINDLELPEPPVLLGHSFGSIIVSSYAVNYPKTICKLILENPIGAPALKGPRGFMSKLATGYYWLAKKLPEPTGTRLLTARPAVMAMSTTMAKTHDKTVRKFIHNQHLQHFSSFASRRVVDEAYQASVSSNVSDFAHDINIPTLLIAGDIDDITSLADQQKLVKLFPLAELKVLSGVGHLTHYETPTEVADAIKKFVD